MSTLDDALAWAARGYRVFPIEPGDKVPWRGLAWKDVATADPATIASWFALRPTSNYGVACGNGLIVVDIDAGRDGFASSMELDLPASTLTVSTPGGGVHIYLQTEHDVPNSVDRLGRGVDVRGAGGYVVGPGSWFADPTGAKGYTGAYAIVDAAPAARVASSILSICGMATERDRSGPVAVDEPADLAYAAVWLSEAPVSIEGQGGNNTAYKVAAKLHELGCSAEAMVDLLAEHWNERCLPPWGRDDLVRFAEHAAVYAKSAQGAGGITAGAAEFGHVVALDEPPAGAKPTTRWAEALRAGVPLDFDEITPDDWIAWRLLARGRATLAAGPGGVGKSNFVLTVAGLGAVGRSLGTFSVKAPFRTVVYNAEDTTNDMSKRLQAVSMVHGIDYAELRRNLTLVSGVLTPLRVMKQDKTVEMQAMTELALAIRAWRADVVVLDPLASLHGLEENDNVAMGELMRVLNTLASSTNTAVLLLHHTPKGSDHKAGSDAVRGAGGIVNSTRQAFTLFPADEHDRDHLGLGERYAQDFVRIDDAKSSYTKRDSKPQVFERVSVPLRTGEESYGLRYVEPGSGGIRSVAALAAEFLAEYMAENSIANLKTHSAAKLLATKDPIFADKVTASMRHLCLFIEMLLVRPVTTSKGATVVVEMKAKKDATSAESYVVLN